ncbi:MAG TPA: hypothetical protein VH165_06485 [Kofleriaceae bacterium]|nr:hypothetical protein [Kofleriaceae bacterium]
MADQDAEAQVLDLQWGASGTAWGLKITFNGGAPVHYGEGKPPAGSVVLILEHDGQTETAAWLQSDWGDPHQAFGYTYRVLNPPELKPRAVRVEVRKAT